MKALAQSIADGKTKAINCPYNGPNQIFVDEATGKLLSCRALSAFFLSSRKDGRGCLCLHQQAKLKGCPFELHGKL